MITIRDTINLRITESDSGKSITLRNNPVLRLSVGKQGPSGPAGAGGSDGDGDMNAATYDPTAVAADVFDLSNHHSGTIETAAVIIDGGLL